MGDVVRGPWPSLPPAKRAKEWPPPGWKRGGLAGMSDTEARRAATLAARPKCPRCLVIYPLNVAVPPDRVCRACRDEPPADGPPTTDDGLF